MTEYLRLLDTPENTLIAWQRQLNILMQHLSYTVKHTEEGGLAVKMINRTGVNTVKGSVVSASTVYEQAFILQATQYDSMGAVYDGGVPDGSYAWVVVSGKADVLLENNTAALSGNWAKSSTVAGRALITTPSTGIGALDVAEHFKEIGHCIQNVVASTNEQTARVVLHFN